MAGFLPGPTNFLVRYHRTMPGGTQGQVESILIFRGQCVGNSFGDSVLAILSETVCWQFFRRQCYYSRDGIEADRMKNGSRQDEKRKQTG